MREGKKWRKKYEINMLDEIENHNLSTGLQNKFLTQKSVFSSAYRMTLEDFYFYFKEIWFNTIDVSL